MTIDRAQPLNSLGSWPAGINNVASDYALAQGELRDAVNVDLTLQGHVRRRKGKSAKRYTGAPHSLFTDGRNLYGGAGTDLCYFTRAPSGALTPTTIRAGLFPSTHKVTWLHFKSPLDRDRVYYTNGLVSGMLVDRVSYPWGVERPTGQPALTAATNGGLDAGTYQVAVTFLSVFGEESGTGESSQVTVVEGGAITASAIPQPASGSVTRINVYVSEPNGAIPYLSSTLAAGTTSVVVGRSLSLGRKLDTRFMQPPPVGEVLEMHGGRIWITAGPLLHFTESIGPGLYRSVNNHLLQAPITLLARTEAGLIVAADKTYMLTGKDARQMQLLERLPYGAYKGTLVRDEREERLYWISPKGLMQAGYDGSIRNVSGGRLVLRQQGVGAAVIHNGNGLRQFVGVLRGGTPDPLLSDDFASSAA